MENTEVEMKVRNESSESSPISSTLTFKNISYSVTVDGAKKKILDGSLPYQDQLHTLYLR